MQSKKSDDNLIRSFLEEHIMKQNKLLSKTNNAIQIQLYYDMNITNSELENQNFKNWKCFRKLYFICFKIILLNY